LDSVHERLYHATDAEISPVVTMQKIFELSTYVT
jgi:hypothetical protein